MPFKIDSEDNYVFVSRKDANETLSTYTKCHNHPEVAQRLLDTGDRTLVETSQYDYFWGLGRDRRGSNVYGAVLMDVRKKLQEEMSTDT
jgi:predicted NAD-dependent protein-ADP-ribosyltransferase YbiA (DUF1768 family)